MRRKTRPLSWNIIQIQTAISFGGSWDCLLPNGEVWIKDSRDRDAGAVFGWAQCAVGNYAYSNHYRYNVSFGPIRTLRLPAQMDLDLAKIWPGPMYISSSSPVLCPQLKRGTLQPLIFCAHLAGRVHRERMRRGNCSARWSI